VIRGTARPITRGLRVEPRGCDRQQREVSHGPFGII
jgi:hypothetical protein